jgi:hypothetical protein
MAHERYDQEMLKALDDAWKFDTDSSLTFDKERLDRAIIYTRQELAAIRVYARWTAGCTRDNGITLVLIL